MGWEDISTARPSVDELLDHVLKEAEHTVLGHAVERLEKTAGFDDRLALGVVFEDGVVVFHRRHPVCGDSLLASRRLARKHPDLGRRVAGQPAKGIDLADVGQGVGERAVDHVPEGAAVDGDRFQGCVVQGDKVLAQLVEHLEGVRSLGRGVLGALLFLTEHAQMDPVDQAPDVTH